MKKTLLAALIIVSLFNLSCEENFSPKADFNNEYVLVSIINVTEKPAPVTSVYAIASRLYDIKGLDPNSERIDPTVSGVDIKITHRKKDYTMIEDPERRLIPYLSNSERVLYECNIPDLKQREGLAIEAKFQNGTVLSASTTVPSMLEFNYSYTFRRGITTHLDKFLWGKKWTIEWFKESDYLFFPKLVVNYTKQINDSTSQFFSKEVPMTYKEGKPIYPSYTRDPLVSYDYDAIDSTMAEISAGEDQKDLFTIQGFSFKVVEYDLPLSNYYSSTNGYLDNFTIRVDERVYSNINGGLGIFGTSMTTNASFPVDKYYARDFGYNAP